MEENVQKKEDNRGGRRYNAGRKPKGHQFGLKGKSKKITLTLPVEIEEWIMTKKGLNRNDKIVRLLFRLYGKENDVPFLW